MSIEGFESNNPLVSTVTAYAPTHPVNILAKEIKDKIDWNNIYPTVFSVMGTLNSMSHLTGEKRLEYLQEVLRIALKYSDVSDEKRSQITGYIDTILPEVAKVVILVHKNKDKMLSALDTLDDKCCNCLPTLSRKKPATAPLSSEPPSKPVA